MEKNEELLDNLMFYTFEGQSAIDRQIKEKILEDFYIYAENKKIEDVLIEISEEGFLTKNKKKPKKRKKKNKKIENEKNDENIDDNKIEINNKNNINIIFDKNKNNNNNKSYRSFIW